MVPHAPSFLDAWVSAATEPGGFWAAEVPSAHFRTASTLGPELADAVAALLRDRPEVGRVVELGAGEGALLRGLGAVRPDLALVGVDVRGRPPGLAGALGWVGDRWDVRGDRWADGAVPDLLADGPPTLVLAVEWLDDLPCPVVSRTGTGWHELDADLEPRGVPAAADEAWLRRWWPDGERAEVGRTRDAAWAAVVRALAGGPGGAALAVDYGHERGSRPPAGSVAAFRAGRAVAPRPRADRNLTAHVALDAVAAAGTAAGARTVLVGRQAEVLPRLLPPVPPSADPLAALAARSRRQALTAPAGWGAHRWLLQEVAAGAVAP
ncbi:SAM-dependent methyltransferase [Microlunatus capsulatus]|uniref:SAM-dependent methyltransferase, MidA family n=1 Tax=Microlunatus capsulatus TaxID=99117 RepID=A0ABS4ZAG5_9ACTN|nr:SAM-dependent methyltransferase [Microlunatus capsulatus]MBP2417750.1 hypothetical protein [Microlunatus capsulatus]